MAEKIAVSKFDNPDDCPFNINFGYCANPRMIVKAKENEQHPKCDMDNNCPCIDASKCSEEMWSLAQGVVW